MTTDDRPAATLIGIPDIAEIAGVQRTAVSNWRKRDPGFPRPVVETPSGLLFDLSDVERWLIEKGKIAHRVRVSAVLWRAADSLRAELAIEEFGRFIGAALVYLEVCERAQRNASGLTHLESGESWDEVRELQPNEVLDGLRRAATRLESRYPELAGLIVDGLTPRRDPTPRAVLTFIELLRRASSEDGTPRFELFEETRDRVHDLARFSEEFATPSSLEFLLARLTADAATIFDPACGEGGVLLMCGLVDGRAAALGPPILHGWDVNPDACRLARTRFFLYDVEATIQCRNSLEELGAPSEIDAVVLDPPYGMRQWGGADLYVSERWRFGFPPPNSADMAWLQLAIESLSPRGGAFVLLPAGSLSRSGREQHIRSAMLKAGVIEAVVLLPSRLRRNTSIPLAVWCLRPAGARRPDAGVLLADASQLGVASRSTVSLAEPEIDSIVDLLRTWSSSGEVHVDDPRIHAVVLGPDEIEDANLSPARYQPIERTDHSALVIARDEALAELRAADRHVRDAMSELVASFEADQR